MSVTAAVVFLLAVAATAFGPERRGLKWGG
jgi:hypothetical protein